MLNMVYEYLKSEWTSSHSNNGSYQINNFVEVVAMGLLVKVNFGDN